MNGTRPLLLVTGIADGLGASVAAAFATSGYDVLGLSRSDGATQRVGQAVGAAGGSYVHQRCDLAEPAQVAAAVSPHADRIAAWVHNAHALMMGASTETPLTDFELAWRVACFGAMAVVKSVLPAMITSGSGTVIFTGATASLRGGARFAAFASAKFALRGLAQSLAREYGPKGVHVAHVVIDGLIDAPQTLQRFGPAPAGRIDPDAVARIYLAIAQQPPSAWTHELDLRPQGESF